MLEKILRGKKAIHQGGPGFVIHFPMYFRQLGLGFVHGHEGQAAGGKMAQPVLDKLLIGGSFS